MTQDVQSTFEISNLNTDKMAGANEVELREVLSCNIFVVFLINSPQAFKLFDADGDGLISAEELKSLISKVKKHENNIEKYFQVFLSRIFFIHFSLKRSGARWLTRRPRP